MVGIVIVSHSKKVAEGIFDLATQMTGPKHSIVLAGGLDDGTIGTDAIKIQDSIIEADQGEGVVVMVDLGSAVLSAETAMELLEDENIKIVIADAPILEGSIGAAIEASIGGTVESVVQAAEAAKSISKI